MNKTKDNEAIKIKGEKMNSDVKQQTIKKQKDDDYIYDRHGNRIRIWVGNDKEEKEIDAKTYNLIFASNFKVQFPYLAIKYPEILLMFPYAKRLEEIKKRLLNKIIKINKIKHFKIELKNKKIKLNNASFSLINDIYINDQYNLKKINIKNKIVIDIGANIGSFSLYAAALGAKKVYAFEPVKATYELLKENIRNNNFGDIIIPINKALGEKEETKQIFFSNAGDVGATMNQQMRKDNVKSINIDIIPLDKFIKENKISRVDFIKMDVEGYEEQVLLGAKETIKKWKPILSFSAYHLPTDKERLPKIVKSIRSDYKITLNKFAEEDFYCE